MPVQIRKASLMSQNVNEDTASPSSPSDQGIQEPPTTFSGILRKLGPGLIIASAIVGSGELIATTKTGAQAGITLLWLIFFGCLIKVFVQIELGRFTISEGETSLSALNSVPGPRLKLNWIVWFWFFMMCTGLAQLGGIVGGVGQAAAIALPLSGDYAEVVKAPSEKQIKWYQKWTSESSQAEFDQLPPMHQERTQKGVEYLEQQINGLRETEYRLEGLTIDDILSKVAAGESIPNPNTWDDRLWALGIALLTAIILYLSRYHMLQTISVVLVVSFTLITLGNVFSLQLTEEFSVSWSELLSGFSFSLPEKIGDLSPLVTAVSAFGIIGVGASELIAYPYWCQEKGYAKYTGTREDSEAWSNRAKGWLKVMHIDAFGAMIIYTVATMAFFFMGATVLFRRGLDPDGMRMVSTLSTAYVPIFGDYARWLFLIGSIAVLYSTFLVANAANARMWVDFFRLAGWKRLQNKSEFNQMVAYFCIALPLICLGIFWSRVNPVSAILLAGMMQSIMLPMIGFAALYFRYKRIDKRLRPGIIWDILLALSCLGLLVTGLWGLYMKLSGFFH